MAHPPRKRRRSCLRRGAATEAAVDGQATCLLRIILIQPIAPVGIFGLASKESHGHVSATIVIAMVAMMLTAFSYGRMAAIYPSAGRRLYLRRPRPGGAFGVSWPVGRCVSITRHPPDQHCLLRLTLREMVPVVPYSVWTVLFVVAITVFNLGCIRAMARRTSPCLRYDRSDRRFRGFGDTVSG